MTHHLNCREISRTMSHMTWVTWVIYDQKVSHTDQTHKKTIKNVTTWIFNANKLHHHHYQVAPPPAPSCTTTNIGCTITNCIRLFTRLLKNFKNSFADQYLCNRTCWLTFNPLNHRLTDYIPPRAEKRQNLVSLVFGRYQWAIMTILVPNDRKSSELHVEEKWPWLAAVNHG